LRLGAADSAGRLTFQKSELFPVESVFFVLGKNKYLFKFAQAEMSLYFMLDRMQNAHSF
jgi:hypothetical protein